MIWEELGDQYISSTIPNYHQRKAEIMAMVNSHDTLPSWNNQEVSVTVGESITLTDSNGVLSGMTLESNNTNATLQQNGNTITITPSASSNDGSITYRKVPQSEVGTSIVYTKPQHQTLVEFHLESSKQATVKVDVIKLGNVQATKIDEDTGKALPNAKLKFEYNGISKEIVTDSNGLATIKDIPEGTTVTITEVTAPNGYFNKGEIKKVVIKPNETIEVKLNNKEQLGQVLLAKTGKEFGTTMFNQYYSLKGAVYGTYKEDGTKVTTITTDEYGKAISSNIKLGKYYALEETAPVGYVLNQNKIPFELKYAGQTIDVTSTSLMATNDFQSLNIQLFKNEESILSWNNNQPVIEVVKGNHKVFGVFTREEQNLSEELQVPANALVGYQTVKDGVATFEMKLPEGKYYLKEIDAGTSHIANDMEYDFEFTAKNNNATYPIHIYKYTVEYFVLSDKTIRIESSKDGIKVFDENNTLLGEQASNNEEPTILLEVKNELKKGSAELTKKDVSTGELLPDTGIRILDEEKNIISEGRTNEKGIYTFEQLPKGIYYFQEYDAPEGYQLDDTPMQFEIKENGEVVKCEMTNKKINENKMIPQTGDTKNTAIFTLGLVLSVSALGVLYFRRKKAKAE